MHALKSANPIKAVKDYIVWGTNRKDKKMYIKELTLRENFFTKQYTYVRIY